MKSVPLDDRLYDYLLRVSLRESDVQRRLREETATLEMAIMQTPPEQAQFMALLAELIGARRHLEVGVFTGYSALAVALALPRDGMVVACDVSEAWTDIARRYWREAGVADRIDLRLAPAEETLAGLVAGGGANSFDMAFIDADKTGYERYYELTLELLRPRGVVLFDNMLQFGRVADPAVDSERVRASRAMNEKLRDDPRVAISLIPVGDGLTLAMKRPTRLA